MELSDFGIDDNWYDCKGNVIDAATACRLLADDTYRFVGLTAVMSTDAAIGYRVSTVWTGRNYGSPTHFSGLFDMLVTDVKGRVVFENRFANLEEATLLHAQAVADWAGTIVGDAVITELVTG